MFTQPLELLVIFCLTMSASAAGYDPFMGKWKLNASKSTITDQMKISSAGANRYAFDFGNGSETITIDGTDQAGNFGTTLSVSAEKPGTWKVVRKKDGRAVITATWNLSSDGTTLTDNYTGITPDGAAHTTKYVYKRRPGGAGFAATWVSTSEANGVFVLEISPYENSGLSFVVAAEGVTKSLNFDGKDYPLLGPNAPAGFTVSGRQVNTRTLEITDKMNGKTTDTQRVELSPDLKILTMTKHKAQQDEPNILVFEREQ